MSKPKLKITFNYPTSPTHAIKKTTSEMIEDPPAKELTPNKPPVQQALDPINALQGQNQVEAPKEKQNPNPEKAEEMQTLKKKTDYMYTLVPQQPAPKATTCSFFSSLFESCKQAPRRSFPLKE